MTRNNVRGKIQLLKTIGGKEIPRKNLESAFALEVEMLRAELADILRKRGYTPDQSSFEVAPLDNPTNVTALYTEYVAHMKGDSDAV